jgi:hypothetical protein
MYGLSQNGRFRCEIVDPPEEHPPGERVAQLLVDELRRQELAPSDIDNWRDSGWSFDVATGTLPGERSALMLARMGASSRWSKRGGFHFDRDSDDDPVFVNEVVGLVRGAVTIAAPKSVFIVKIDSWFGPRWLSFSCKMMGAFGVSYLDELVIPPFVPRRVRSERSYEWVGDHFVETYGTPPLHIWQTSEANKGRRLKDMHPHAAMFWWTGNTRSTGRGALMAYLPTPDGHTNWYAELRLDGEWKFGRLLGVGGDALRALRYLRPLAGSPGLSPPG